MRELTIRLMNAVRDGDHIPTVMHQYFQRADDGTVVWWMTHGAPVRPVTPFLRRAFDIVGDGGAMISIGDPFDAREPQRIDAHAARGGEARIEFRVEFMLDSQVVTYLDQFVRRSPRLTDPHRKLVERLLRFAIQKRIGYNPAFYFLEALSRPGGHERDFARESARSILTLHTMDDRHFLNTGEVRPSLVAQERYMQEYNCTSFESAADAYAEGFVGLSGAERLEETSAHRVRYATLLAIAAIHRQRPGTNWDDIKKKCEAFDDFLGQLGGEMGLERLVAVRYFAGGIDAFLPVQKGARVDKVFARIKAAVWDLDFLSMPAFLLVQSPDHGVVVGYPCTADKLLAELAKSLSLELVVAPRGEPIAIPIFTLRGRHLERALAIRGRTRPWPMEVRRLEESELDAIISDQEKRVVAFC